MIPTSVLHFLIVLSPKDIMNYNIDILKVIYQTIKTVDKK